MEFGFCILDLVASPWHKEKTETDTDRYIVRLAKIASRKVEMRLPSKGNLDSHGARPVY